MGDEDDALGGSDEGPEGVWGGKCIFGLFCPALKVSSAAVIYSQLEARIDLCGFL